MEVGSLPPALSALWPSDGPTDGAPWSRQFESDFRRRRREANVYLSLI